MWSKMKSLKKNSQLKNVHHGFQPIYYYSRCVGLWPFTIAYNLDGSIKEAHVQVSDILWCLVSVCLYLASQYHYIDSTIINANPTNKTYLSNLIYVISHMSFLSFAAVGILLNMHHRKKLVNILDNFAKFDSTVKYISVYWRNDYASK